MKQYYYSDGKEQFRPLTIEDLKKKNLLNDVLVLTEGLDNWVSLQSIPDLHQQFKMTPPPMPTAKKHF